MKTEEVERIISSYKPNKGFFDLSRKPDSLADEEYAKILKTQNYLVAENKKIHSKEVRENNKTHWNELRELSAKLQKIIFQHWDLSVLN